MNTIQSTILQLLSKAIFDGSISKPEQDWTAILTEAKNQAVVQLIDSVLDKSLLTPDEAKVWKQVASQDIANNIRIGHNHSVLHEWMSASDIPYVILKGAASASFYPIPAYRSMGDVDFLVKEEDLEKAEKILEEHGLKPWDEEHISHIVYRGPRMHYEMHLTSREHRMGLLESWCGSTQRTFLRRLRRGLLSAELQHYHLRSITD